MNENRKKIVGHYYAQTGPKDMRKPIIIKCIETGKDSHAFEGSPVINGYGTVCSENDNNIRSYVNSCYEICLGSELDLSEENLKRVQDYIEISLKKGINPKQIEYDYRTDVTFDKIRESTKEEIPQIDEKKLRKEIRCEILSKIVETYTQTMGFANVPESGDNIGGIIFSDRPVISMIWHGDSHLQITFDDLEEEEG